MYVVYNIDYIHHLLNESKKWKVVYIWNRREYVTKKNSYKYVVRLVDKLNAQLSIKIYYLKSLKVS